MKGEPGAQAIEHFGGLWRPDLSRVAFSPRRDPEAAAQANSDYPVCAKARTRATLAHAAPTGEARKARRCCTKWGTISGSVKKNCVVSEAASAAWPLAALCHQMFGSGVICETGALPATVIPAQAGIYSANHWKSAAEGLDSRFRGNDHGFEGDLIPNDTSTRCSTSLRPLIPSVRLWV